MSVVRLLPGSWPFLGGRGRVFVSWGGSDRLIAGEKVGLSFIGTSWGSTVSLSNDILIIFHLLEATPITELYSQRGEGLVGLTGVKAIQIHQWVICDVKVSNLIMWWIFASITSTKWNHQVSPIVEQILNLNPFKLSTKKSKILLSYSRNRKSKFLGLMCHWATSIQLPASVHSRISPESQQFKLPTAGKRTRTTLVLSQSELSAFQDFTNLQTLWTTVMFEPRIFQSKHPTCYTNSHWKVLVKDQQSIG